MPTDINSIIDEINKIDINTLIEQLNVGDDIMRFNTSVENEIIRNSGKIIYSYNNMIIASDISDEYYNELAKNILIETLYIVPLKRYGDIDNKLIGQIDISKLELSGKTGVTEPGGNKTDPTPAPVGTAPIITSNLLKDVYADSGFSYKIAVSGSTPIRYEAEWMASSVGFTHDKITLVGNVLTSKVQDNGTFNIILKATNNFGTDQKLLAVKVIGKQEIPKITSDLIAYGTVNTGFTYQILQTGYTVTTTYNAYGLPSGLLSPNSNGLISGTLTCVAGVYRFPIIIQNEYGSDQKMLELRVSNSGTTSASLASAPIITSSTNVNGLRGDEFIYNIIATGSVPMTYRYTNGVVPYGSLGWNYMPDGLSLKDGVISGIPPIGYSHYNLFYPTTVYYIKIYAKNFKGESFINLKITLTVPS